MRSSIRRPLLTFIASCGAALYAACAATSSSDGVSATDGGSNADQAAPLDAGAAPDDAGGGSLDAPDDAVDDADANVDTRPRGEVVVANEANPRGVAVDDLYVYWATNGASASDKAIRRAPVGGAAPTTLVSGLAGPIVVTSDANYVYFVEFVLNDGSIKRVAKAGGAAETLVVGADATVAILSPDATSILYGTSDGTIRRVVKTGGTPTDLVTGRGYMFGLAADAQYLYFTTGVTTGGPSPIPTTTVYTLERAPIGGGASTVLYTPAFSGGALYGVALASDKVVFANEYENRVYELSPDGGAPQMLTSGTQPSQLVSDGVNAFWINDLGAAHASIGRYALTGAAVSPTLAYEQPGAYGITYDATHVYWANRVEGTIRRAAK